MLNRPGPATTLAALLLSALVLANPTGAAPSARGIGFELKKTSISPKHPLFDAKRDVTLHYGFGAKQATDLQIQVLKSKSGNVMRVYTERDATPGKRLKRPWNGLTRRGKAAGDGRYEFRVGPKGGPMKFAGRFRLHTHVFPVDGPHGTRGAIGEFGAPRSGGRTHEGFDITGDCGTPLLAARGGTIQKVAYDPILDGNYVVIDGRKTSQDYLYAHLIAPSPFHKHDLVKTGQFVGRIGQTGNAAGTPCHLHFEVHIHGKPVDPEPYLKDWDKHG